MHDSIDDQDRVFIEARDMFFLATADEVGRRQCSYKAGEPDPANDPSREVIPR